MNKSLIFLFVFLSFQLSAQTWNTVVENINTFSSPKTADLNNDGTLDIVMGGGVENMNSDAGVFALDGSTGSILWSMSVDNEIFGTPVFMDITSDGIPEVFISGRTGNFLAINGSTGSVIWNLKSHITLPWMGTDIILNLYNPQPVPDQNSDGIMDFLISYGGDHAAPYWEEDRPAGTLLIVSGSDGSILYSDQVPDKKETYNSPVVHDMDSDGDPEIIFGTGGENHKGHLYIAHLSDLVNGTIDHSRVLASGTSRGFIAPVSLADVTGDNIPEIFAVSFEGTVYAFDGSNLNLLWQQENAGTETAATPVIGNFTGSYHSDVAIVLAEGETPSYTGFRQVLYDGVTGKPELMMEEGDLQFAPPVAADLDLDGFDELIYSRNTHNGSYYEHEVLMIDEGVISVMIPATDGANMISSPLITDLSDDGIPELVFTVRQDSINPGNPMGLKIYSKSLSSYSIPPQGLGWGGYLGTSTNGKYTYSPTSCDLNISQSTQSSSCNSTPDASADITVSGGTAPYNYIWNNGSFNEDLTGVYGGKAYTVRVVDAAGCIAEQSINIPNRYTISFHVTPNNCPDGTSAIAQVNSTGCACMTSSCTYSWSNGSNVKNPSGLSSGWHYVTIDHGDGCIANDSVYVGPSPVKAEFSSYPESSPGASDGWARVFASGGTAPYTYSWNDPSSQSDSLAEGLTEGQYQVTITDANSCEHTALLNIYILAVKNQEIGDALVFPVPSNGPVKITTGRNDDYKVKIYSGKGELLDIHSFYGNTYKININYGPGMYILTLENSKGKNTYRIVIR